MKNKTLLTGLAGLLVAFFVMAGVVWADNGNRYQGRHGDYRGNGHFDKWDRHGKWGRKGYDKWDRGRYKSYLEKDYRHDDRYFHKRYDHKYKVRPHYRKHSGKYYYRGQWHTKPYYYVPRHQSAFTFGTSFFDPGFFFGFSVRERK